MEQAAACLDSLIRSFSVRGWFAKELRADQIAEYPLFVEDVRFLYLDGDNVGPDVADKIFFLSGFPEFSQIENFDDVPPQLLIMQHMMLDFPEVTFESPNSVGNGPGLSAINKTVQSFLLSSDPD